MTSRMLTLALATTLATAPIVSLTSGALAAGHDTSSETSQTALQDEALARAKEIMAAEKADGAVVAIHRDGVEASAAIGNVTNLSLSADGRLTSARIGSITKTMVATLVMQEVERGTWTLDQPISEILPDINIDRSDITLRQLLSHTSGIPNWTGGQAEKPDADPRLHPDGSPAEYDPSVPIEQYLDSFFKGTWTVDQQLAWAGTYQWGFEPGTEHSYSNTGYLVVGKMLEHVTGKPLAELLQDRIFQPASMLTASYQQPLTAGSPATSYLPDVHHYSDGAGNSDRYDTNASDLSWGGAAGAVIATMPELNRFHLALHGGLLVSQKSLKEMRTPVLDGYGLGTFPYQAESGLVMWGHNGSTFGTKATSFISEDGAEVVSTAVSAPEIVVPTTEAETTSRPGNHQQPALTPGLSAALMHGATQGGTN